VAKNLLEAKEVAAGHHPMGRERVAQIMEPDIPALFAFELN
jgi:hypothetical protein